MTKFLYQLVYSFLSGAVLLCGISFIFDPSEGTKHFFGTAVFLLYIAIGILLVIGGSVISSKEVDLD
jgi:glycerol uptake facilitator-like aquaporin